MQVQKCKSSILTKLAGLARLQCISYNKASVMAFFTLSLYKLKALKKNVSTSLPRIKDFEKN